MAGWASAAIGLGTFAYGLYNKGKANKKAAELQASRPKLQDSQYLKDQLSLAESNLSTGMSAESKNAYETDLDKSLSTSLSTVLKGGGSVNNISELLSSDQQGRQRLAMMKDNLRLANIDRLTRAQDAEEQFRQEQFQVNSDAPWKDAAQANAQAKQSAENTMWSGIGMAGSGVLKGLEGARSAASYASALNPGASNPNNVSTASTAGGYSNPAGQYSTLNPNTSGPSLVDTLLENPNG